MNLPLEKNSLPRVEAAYLQLTQTEKEIADYFLNDWRPDDDLSAQFLSKKLFVSVPSLTRFAKKCGYTGYRQFVFELQEIKYEDHHLNNELTRNVLHDYERLLTQTYSLIDEKQLWRVGEMLDASQRVYIYGKGSSGQVANEMKLRFMRLGLVCEAITDDHMMRTNRVLIDETCVVIALSIRAETPVVMASLRDAQRLGAKTILMTANPAPELQALSDELILVATRSSLAYGTTISPQFPMLVVVDIFYAYYMNLNHDFRRERFNDSLEALNIQDGF